MRVRFWGTRGSIAKPGSSTLRYGGNTSCVEVRSPDGTLIVLDCGTGAHALGKSLVDDSPKTTRGHLLITHTHWDHIQGFPFFAPLRLPQNRWDVYGPRGVGGSLRDTLAGQMNYDYFPVDLNGLDANVTFQELVEGNFDLGDVRVEARYLNHPAVTLGYRVEVDGVVVVYATDHEPHSRHLAVGEPQAKMSREDDAHAEFLEGADLVIHDTQYTALEYPDHVGWGHSTVEYVVDRTHDKGIARLALYHHDPMRTDEGVDQLVDIAKDRLRAKGDGMRVLAAAEGMTLELERRPRRTPARASRASARRAPQNNTSTQPVVLCARIPENLDVFRSAALADGLTLMEAADLETVLERVSDISPTVVILEIEAMGDDFEETAKRLRSAMGDKASQLTVIGLVDSARVPHDELSASSQVNEWVETPLTEQYARTRLRAWLLRAACRWRRAPVPSSEQARIKALHELEILDTPPEERFDRLTRLAAALFNVPTALVSLVNTDRQWFKSRHGLNVDQTPRDQAFCTHAILRAAVFQVTDASVHPDFADNPLVTGPPYVRFYAGIPLSVGNQTRVGTLCLIDQSPRELDETQCRLLRDLGRLVEQELIRTSKDG